MKLSIERILSPKNMEKYRDAEKNNQEISLELEIELQKKRDEAESIKEKIKNTGIPPKYFRHKFSDFDFTDNEVEGRLIFGWNKKFINNKGIVNGFLMHGPVGTGKTLIASLIAKKAMFAGASVRYMTHKALNNRISSTWNKHVPLTQEEVIRNFTSLNLFIIDEIKLTNSLELVQALEEIIDNRYNLGKPTILITNENKDMTRKIVGDRVWSRCCAGLLSITGRDRRKDENPFSDLI